MHQHQNEIYINPSQILIFERHHISDEYDTCVHKVSASSDIQRNLSSTVELTNTVANDEVVAVI